MTPPSRFALTTQSGQQSRRARSGNDTEALVSRLHIVCEQRGIAHVYKRPTPTVGAHGSLRFAARSGADYGGWLLDGSGRAVSVEVKRCTERRLLLSRIEDHQRTELDLAERAGAITVLLVVYGPALPTASLHAVPWGVVAAMVANAARDEDAPRSLGPDELAPWRVPSGAPYLSCAWLTRRAA